MNTSSYRFTRGLAIYLFISTIYLCVTIVTTKFMNVKPTNENTVYLITYTTYYYTLWNLISQGIFLTLAVLDELIVSLTGRLDDRLRTARRYVFVTIVSPNTTMVVLGFWLFCYFDRELIYPRAIDDDVPFVFNLFAHLFVALPILVEIALARSSNFEPFRSSLPVLTVYLVVYNVGLFSLYFRHGIWLYPFLYKMPLSLTCVWTVFAISCCLLLQRVGEIILTLAGAT